MRAKEYLKKLWELNRDIDRKQSNLDQLREMSTRVKGYAYDKERVQTSARNTSEDLIIKIIDLERDITEEIDTYVDYNVKVSSQIEEMENTHYRDILFKRYVLGESFKDITTELHLSYDHVRHLHGYALLEFEKKFFKVDTQ